MCNLDCGVATRLWDCLLPCSTCVCVRVHCFACDLRFCPACRSRGPFVVKVCRGNLQILSNCRSIQSGRQRIDLGGNCKRIQRPGVQGTCLRQIVDDCLPYRAVETRTVRAMTRSLDPKCPDFGRKAIISKVRRCPENCSVLAIVFNMFFPFVEVANADIAMWKLWRARLEK